MSTFGGRMFMTAFNAAYYSFSPSVAVFVAERPWFTLIVRIMIYPMISMLRLTSLAFNSFPADAEIGVLLYGLLSSCLIGLIYLLPIAVVFDLRKTGNDYRYHIEIEAKRQLLELLKGRFNLGVKHNGKTCKWDTVILHKTKELGGCLLEKFDSPDLKNPSPNLDRSESQVIGKRLFGHRSREARNSGIKKGALCSLQLHMTSSGSLRAYRKTREEIEYPAHASYSSRSS